MRFLNKKVLTRQQYIQFEKGKVDKMLKGVNRRIIEISNTENKYFERAIVFVKPQYNNSDEATLKREADGYISSVCKNGDGFLRNEAAAKKRKKLFGILLAAVLAATAAAVWLIIR